MFIDSYLIIYKWYKYEAFTPGKRFKSSFQNTKPLTQIIHQSMGNKLSPTSGQNRILTDFITFAILVIIHNLR